MAVVTISASYAAGGSEIGPRVATRLGVPFIDRAIPVAVAHELGITEEEAEAVAQDAPSRFWAILAGMSIMPGYMGMDSSADQIVNERQLIEKTEAQIRKVADAGNCVILGRAAAIVLADRPDALHVRLDGSISGRIEAAMHQHGIDRDTATAAQKENDKLRSGYVEHFYRRNSADVGAYHVVIDSVRLGWDRTENLIVDAARLIDAAPSSLDSAPSAVGAPQSL
jgi:cytidylate kinase